MNQLELLKLALPLCLVLAACSEDETVKDTDAITEDGGEDVAFDPQIPPAERTAMAAWLEAFAREGWEDQWVCETAPTAKTEGAPEIHVHNDRDGKNRVCNNVLLASVERGGVVPKGGAALKFVGDRTYAEVKIADDSQAGDGWYWYAPGGDPEGTGISACTGCHAAASSDAEHPGLGDYVYFQARR